MLHLVITAFKRTEFFELLKKSLKNQTNLPASMKLWFYIDKSEYQLKVKDAINNCFKNDFEIEIVLRERFEGLKNNTFFAISETFERTDATAIVHLEDDLFICDEAINFSCNAIKMQNVLGNDILGVSLFSQHNNPWTYFPLNFQAHSFFTKISLSSSCGAVIYKSEWYNFYRSLKNQEFDAGEKWIELLPKPMLNWNRKNSWKFELGLYMMARNKYFLNPQVSFTAHLGKAGTHVSENSNAIFNGSLNRPGITYNYEHLYLMNMDTFDIYFEPSSGIFHNIFDKEILENLVIDLYGTKPLSISKKYWLTSKKVKKSLRSFGYEIKNPTDNILNEVPGNFFHLSLAEDIIEEPIFFRKEFLESLIGSRNGTNLLKYLWNKLIS